MLFLKRKDQTGKGNGSCIWCDANESIDLFIKHYPQNAGDGERINKIKTILRKPFIQQVYTASYTAARGAAMTDEEREIWDRLPTEIKRIENRSKAP